MDELAITYRGVVYPWHCDHMGHMNVMWYVSKFDEATWQMFASIGITVTSISATRCGVAAIRQNVSYRRELRAGDLITIRTGILGIVPKQIRFYHEMYNDNSGDLSATTLITGVYMHIDKRQTCLFPDEIIQRAKTKLVNITPIT